jgi:tetratricopeptide (TPR) repeat protein
VAPAAARASGSTRTAGSYNNEGILLRGERREAEARTAFERAIELDPNLASALWNLSDLLFAANETERSDELLARALGNQLPDGVKFVVGRAIGYQRAGQIARSLALLDRAVAVAPAERELWLFRGRYRVEAQDCRGALGDFGRAAELAPEDPAVHASAGLALVCLGDRRAAAEALRRSLALEPGQERVRAMLRELERGG